MKELKMIASAKQPTSDPQVPCHSLNLVHLVRALVLVHLPRRVQLIPAPTTFLIKPVHLKSGFRRGWPTDQPPSSFHPCSALSALHCPPQMPLPLACWRSGGSSEECTLHNALEGPVRTRIASTASSRS